MSKIVEKGMLLQINEHLRINNLLPDYISAYREMFSTETALIKVVNDILINMDGQLITPLIALDLSAAFDTVDHTVLLSVLEKQFGIQGKALDWFCNYLNERKLRVRVGQSFSDEMKLPFSVPQGSCAGPVLFNLYASTLRNFISDNLQGRKGVVSLIGYADDHSYYSYFKPSSTNEEAHCIRMLEDCAKIVGKWMNLNRLQLNSSKTEFIKFGSSTQLQKCIIEGIDIIDTHVNESISIKYLGVHLDNELSFCTHITEKCKTAMFQLHRIRVLRSHLSRKSLELIIHSLVLSQLDYCCTLLYGLPNSSLAKLQRVQNFAAKLIFNKNKFDSATECLKELHWLPIKYRILFRLLCMSYKCVNDQAPNYLSSYFIKKESGYSLRSKGVYVIPRTRTRAFGDRAFSVSGPREWNNLPADLQSCGSFTIFRKKLKTYLFRKAFQ